MSRIHQAIRRAEKEKAPAVTQGLEFRRNSLDADFFAKRSKQRLKPEVSVFQQLGNRVTAESVSEAEPFEWVDLNLARGSKIVTLSDPTSLASNQYHVLKGKLGQMRQDKTLKTMLITSPSSSEGKTLTAVNLALTLAQEIEQRVLLVDANLKNPALHSLLGLMDSKGLVNMLAGELSSSEVILRTKISNFYVVPSGKVKEGSKELLNCEALKDFLAYVKEKFDWVIVDSPSITPFAEVDLLTSLVDGILVVVRASQNPTPLISESIQPLKKRNLLGFVFNGVRVPVNSAGECW
jgi:protein-tyrosine kinase